MSYLATVFKVMIASPSDVEAERGVVRETLSEWNTVNSGTRHIVLLPIGWETHSAPEMGDRPQAIINKRVLQDCDLLIGVFWTRIGTATGGYASGTVEEIEEHLRANKPVMLYFSSAPVLPESVDHEQYAALQRFRDSCKSRGIFETYSSLGEFKSKLYRQLQIKLSQDTYFANEQQINSPIAQPQPSVLMGLSLSREAQVLLVECAKDPSGVIMRIHHLGGSAVQTGGRNFIEENNPRSEAIWEGALKELERNELVVSAGSKGEIFKLTRQGYEMADLLR